MSSEDERGATSDGIPARPGAEEQNSGGTCGEKAPARDLNALGVATRKKMGGTGLEPVTPRLVEQPVAFLRPAG
jgi:hypothetical protein